MKVKVGLIGIFDMLKFKNLGKKREEAILKAEAKSLAKDYKVNELARLYHPYKQHLVIKEIIDEGKDVKSFILIPDNELTKELAPFKAGSYLSIYVEFNNQYLSRTYSISSSPKDALVNNFYKITVKKVDNGALSTYLLDEAKVGMKLTSTEPGGFLTFNKFRDSSDVIAIAGGVGITPFISMAKAIIEEEEDFNLTILYGVKTQKDILFKDELNEITSKCNKVKVIYVYSDEVVEGEEHGFIGAELIKKYAPSNYSIFATGPRGLLDFLAIELPKLDLEQKYIRLEQSPLTIKNDDNVYKIKVILKDEVKVIEAKGNETILQAFERNNIVVRAKCHLGGCGYCRSKLLNGKYEATRFEKLDPVDKKFSYIHPCCSYPRSDMEIEIFEY